ncbi:phosphodiester glycosidase family protein [Mesorhizobium sp. NPDC059054]|uniref:phosphodiester glycosidase family protein n=1 Tax=Mesorhizobium sp. NPDC059054 TaxID=3346711 RepID=UPI00368B55AA
MTRRTWLVLLVLLLTGAGLAAWFALRLQPTKPAGLPSAPTVPISPQPLPPASQSVPSPLPTKIELPEPCREFTFEAVAYVVCEIDLRRYTVTLHRLDPAGKPYGSVTKFTEAMRVAGTPALIAMNAGMYHKDLSPVGLFVEDGDKGAPLNRDDAEGNFFLKPNGVFYIGTDGKAGVAETGAFATANPTVTYATQSGPMLVIDGALHPRFEPNGTSRYIRNGVGVRDPDTVILVISRGEVSLGSFARLFRDALGCRNALFFDGAVSTLSNGTDRIVGGSFPAGPILAVRMKP